MGTAIDLKFYCLVAWVLIETVSYNIFSNSGFLLIMDNSELVILNLVLQGSRWLPNPNPDCKPSILNINVLKVELLEEPKHYFGCDFTR